MKLTLAPRSSGLGGTELAALLEKRGIFCEFADPDFVTLMLTPANTDEELLLLRDTILGALHTAPSALTALPPAPRRPSLPERCCSLRAAMLAPAQTVPVAESLGRILARPGVACPPAVPILMPGERIDADAVAAFSYYGIDSCRVLTSGR